MKLLSTGKQKKVGNFFYFLFILSRVDSVLNTRYGVRKNMLKSILRPKIKTDSNNSEHVAIKIMMKFINFIVRKDQWVYFSS